jgi:putative membrane protein
MKISDSEKTQIKNLITEKEALTDCEIVPMIVQASSNYQSAHLRMAILVSFLFSLALYYSPLYLDNPIYLLWIQLPGLLVGYLLCFLPFFKRLFSTKSEMNHEVTLNAYEVFMHHNLHLTKNHNGILIFISRFERKIRIVTDNGIKSKIDDKVWDNVIQNFIKVIQNENIISALKATISEVGTILEKTIPITEKKSNELENDLIIE